MVDCALYGHIARAAVFEQFRPVRQKAARRNLAGKNPALQMLDDFIPLHLYLSHLFLYVIMN